MSLPVCVCVYQTPACVLGNVLGCGQIKIVLYRISFWRGRDLSVYLCAVASFAGIAIDPALSGMISFEILVKYLR